MEKYPVRMVRASKELRDFIDEKAAQYDKSRSYITWRILKKHFQESTTGVEGCTISSP
jgi:hypothetical protein